MKIGIITSYDTYHINQLKNIAVEKGHSVTIVPIIDFDITNIEKSSLVKEMLKQDVVIFRGSEKIARTLIGATLNERGVKYINGTFFKHPLSFDKSFQSYWVRKNTNVNVPLTIVSGNIQSQTYEQISSKLGEPFIAKKSVGSLGKQVYLIRRRADFDELFVDQNIKHFVFQSLIPNSGDYRIYVVGGKAIDGYHRVPAEGEFRANISLGGHGEIIHDQSLKKNLFRAAEKIAKAFEAEVIGIDLILSEKNNKIYFIEANHCAQWQGLETTTGSKIGETIIEYLETLNNNS